jgi:hypothetical protein
LRVSWTAWDTLPVVVDASQSLIGALLAYLTSSLPKEHVVHLKSALLAHHRGKEDEKVAELDIDHGLGLKGQFETVNAVERVLDCHKGLKKVERFSACRLNYN